MNMEYYALLEKQNKSFQERQQFLSKEEIRYIAQKDTFPKRLRGFLTRAYYQKDKLIKRGQIVYGYVYKEWSQDVEGNVDPFSWVLISPERKIMENPSIFQKTAAKLQDFSLLPGGNRREKLLKNQLNEALSDAPFEELPQSLTEGHLIYLCKLQRPLALVSFFHLGLNLFLFNPSISKQILFLPERYMTDDFKQCYMHQQLGL